MRDRNEKSPKIGILGLGLVQMILKSAGREISVLVMKNLLQHDCVFGPG